MIIITVADTYTRLQCNDKAQI